MAVSFHYENHRKNREQFIQGKGYDTGKSVALFRVVRNGTPQLQIVTSTGLIVVKDMKGRVITKMIARPEQIKRLYAGIGMEPPEEVLMLAYLHNVNGYNRK